MLNLICGLLFSIIPVQTEPVDFYDVIEINERYDNNGVFEEYCLIFRDWNGQTRRFEVQDRRYLDELPDGLVARDWSNGGFIVRFTDEGDSHVVRVRSVSETWTQYNPLDYERWVGKTRYLRGNPPPCNESHCEDGC